jgi:acyl-CoA synthetase (AMP-forming)/AMP-acid ligase II
VICSTPLYSNTTLVSFLPTLTAGGKVVLMKKFDARGFLELSQRERVTHAMLVPVQYRRIMEVPDFDRFDLSSYRLKSSTSAPFPAWLKADVLRRWPGGLTDGYGMTEGGATAILVAHNPDKLHTVGRPPRPHHQDHRRGRARAAAGRSRRNRRPFADHDERLSRQDEKTREANGSTPKGAATSATAISASLTRTAS